MENVEKLLKTALQEIEKLLNTKTAVGEPIVVGENTIIPLISAGFGFGAGGGSGKANQGGDNEGEGAGTGGGGGIKPVAVLIINKDGVRLESVKSGAASAFEKVVKTVADVAVKSKEKKEEAS